MNGKPIKFENNAHNHVNKSRQVCENTQKVWEKNNTHDINESRWKLTKMSVKNERRPARQ